MPRLFTGLEIPSPVGFMLSLKRGGLPGARCTGALRWCSSSMPNRPANR